MPRISTDNYDTVASWNGSQDLFVVEQPDGTKVATPAMVKQFIEAGDFEATGEVKDGHGNLLNDMASRAIIVKASTSDYKNYSIPKTIWTTHGFGSGSNHTALFCGGYANRISAGFLGISSDGVSVIKLGNNTVTVSISGDNIIIAFSDTVYTDLRLVLFN